MFSAAQSYERFMGRWSREVARLLVPFAQVRDGDTVLDIGCGTGALTKAIAAAAPTSRIIGVDRSPPFIASARSTHAEPRFSFELADAQRLPFGDACVDRTLSLFILNFVPDPVKALREMIRVTRAEGTVTCAVWDYSDGMQMLSTFWEEAIALDPAGADRDERTMPLCGRGELDALWRTQQFAEVAEQTLTIPMRFESFDDYWLAFLEGQGPAGAYTTSLRDEPRERLRLCLRRRFLGDGADRPFVLEGRAWAVRGRLRPRGERRD
jgi:SAM-dependent methyltransferase